jgi:ABC-type sugar transport system substrate-binding protein
MTPKSVGLCLADAENEFLKLTVAEAQTAAQQAGLTLDTRFTADDLTPQYHCVSRWLESDAAPVAILIMASREKGFARLAKQALSAGIHWFYLNRTDDSIEELRSVNPLAAVAEVSSDDLEVGRIQGRIARRLKPAGGRLLHVLGGRSVTARERAAGFDETKGPAFTVSRLETGWSIDDTRAAVTPWLRTAARSRRAPELVVCQTDNIAMGVLASLSEVAEELGQESLTYIPIVGCDGTPSAKSFVDQGRLAATVTLSRPGAAAIGWVASVLSGKDHPPARVALPPAAYPA